MATTRATTDVVTLASLHAALDAILEVETLCSRMNLPAKRRLGAMAAEMRLLLGELLRPAPAI